MGCLHSTAAQAVVPAHGPALRAGPPETAKEELPQYMTADPDLGWRNVSVTPLAYPLSGFTVDFQNERSGNVLKKLDLVALALNIAVRAGRLAQRYGVADQTGFQSSSNLLEDLAALQRGEAGTTDDSRAGWHIDIRKDMKKILKHFSCPDFGWELLSRVCETAPYLSKSPHIFFIGDPPMQASTDESLGPAHDDPQQSSILHELGSVPTHLQKLRDADKKLYILDVTEIGINIAEQLFRLEKSEATGHRIPNDCFGWQILSHEGPAQGFAVPVSTPEHEAVMMVPEELIMHVASWVQRTYLTAPAF